MKTTLIIMAVGVSILSASCAKRCTNKDVIGMVHHSQTLIDQDLITVLEYEGFFQTNLQRNRVHSECQ